ncbi:MAG: ABC transporter substrate-binding protein [Streptosporangiales bacterium]
MARRLWGLAATTLTAVALVTSASCNPAAQSGSSQDGGDGGSTLVIARTADVDVLDPHRATAFQTVQALGLVYDSLLTTDAKGELAPRLAQHWNVSKDGKTVSFTLRKGVKFHNGDPLTATDVKASLERVLDPKTAGVGASNLASVKTVDTRSDHQVVLHLSKPDSALLYALTSVNTSIVDHASIKSNGKLPRKPNGTGPYRFGERKQGSQLTLEANKAYWGTKPEIDKIQIRVIPSESSILSGMRSGAFDLGLITDPSVAHQVKGGKVDLVKKPSLPYHALMLNGRHHPLDKLKVRQAIACALDRQQVIDTALDGDGKVTGPITSPAFSYPPTAGLPCNAPDTAKAKQLLSQAGYPDGFKVDCLVPTGLWATGVAEAENVQAQLAKVGVQLTLNKEPSNVYVQDWLKADFDTTIARNGGSYNPYLMYGRYFTTGGSLKKPAGLTSDELSSLLAKGNAQTSTDAQRQTYQQLQKQMLHLSPWVWILQEEAYYLVGSDVHGFQPMPDESLRPLVNASVG